jgi:hypothetical protein
MMSFEIMLKPCMKTDKETIFEDDMVKIKLDPEYMAWVRFYNMIHLRKVKGRVAEIGNDRVTIITKDDIKPYPTRRLDIETAYIIGIRKIRG